LREKIFKKKIKKIKKKIEWLIIFNRGLLK